MKAWSSWVISMVAFHSLRVARRLCTCSRPSSRICQQIQVMMRRHCCWRGMFCFVCEFHSYVLTTTWIPQELYVFLSSLTHTHFFVWHPFLQGLRRRSLRWTLSLMLQRLLRSSIVIIWVSWSCDSSSHIKLTAFGTSYHCSLHSSSCSLSWCSPKLCFIWFNGLIDDFALAIKKRLWSICESYVSLSRCYHIACTLLKSMMLQTSGSIFTKCWFINFFVCVKSL